MEGNAGGAHEPLRLPGAFATYKRGGAALANHGVGKDANATAAIQAVEEVLPPNMFLVASALLGSLQHNVHSE